MVGFLEVWESKHCVAEGNYNPSIGENKTGGWSRSRSVLTIWQVLVILGYMGRSCLSKYFKSR